MKLRASCDDGGHCGRSHAGADVACEIYQSRDSIAFFTLYADVCRSHSWHKHEAQRHILDDAQPCCMSKTHFLIELHDGNIHSDCQAEPTESDQVAQLKQRREPADEGQFKKQEYCRRR